jgi:hypothetical protein
MKAFSVAEIKQHRCQINGYACNTEGMTMTRGSLKYSQKFLSHGHTVQLKSLMDRCRIKPGLQSERPVTIRQERRKIFKKKKLRSISSRKESISLTFFFKSKVYFILLHFHTEIITECPFNVQVLGT